MVLGPRSRYLAGWLTGLLLVALSAESSHAAAVYAINDSYIESNDTADNNGGKGRLDVEGRPHKVESAFLKFDLSPLPTDPNAIDSTIARLFVVRVKGKGQIGFHVVLGDWNEGQLTFDNKPPVNPTPFATRNITDADEGTYVTVDITELARSWVSGTLANNGIAVCPVESGCFSPDPAGARSGALDGLYVKFQSKEGRRPSLRRMTGRGRIRDSGTRFLVRLNCDPLRLPHKMTVRWRAGRRDRHKFVLEDITTVGCDQKPDPMRSQWGEGLGILDGSPGAMVEWVFGDGGAPGLEDSVRLLVKDPDGQVVLDLNTMIKGNLRAREM